LQTLILQSFPNAISVFVRRFHHHPLDFTEFPSGETETVRHLLERFFVKQIC